MTYPNSQFVNTVSSGGTSTAPFITILKDNDPTPYDTKYSITQRWINTTNSLNPTEWILSGFTSTNGIVLANWVQLGSNDYDVQTLTGNTGTATASANNINVVGVTAQGITSAGSSDTLLITASDATTTQKGVSRLATNAEAIAGAITTNVSINPSSLSAKLGNQTQYYLTVGQGSTSALGYIAPSSTTGSVFLSKGSSSNPGYSTTFVVNDTSFNTTLSGANAGSIVEFSIKNTDVSASNSSSRLTLTANGLTNSGDAYLQFDPLRGSSFAMQLGYSQSNNALQIRTQINSSTSTLSGSTALSISNSSGAITFNSSYTFPTTDGTAGQQLTTNGAGVVTWSNPVSSINSFIAYLNTTLTGVTGSGSPGTVVTIICDTIVNQQGSAYNSTTGVFTAPTTGNYFFQATVTYGALNSTNNTGITQFYVNGAQGSYFAGADINLSTARDGANNYRANISSYFYLTAGDTVTLTGAAGGSSTNNVNIAGVVSGVSNTYFCGFQVR